MLRRDACMCMENTPITTDAKAQDFNTKNSIIITSSKLFEVYIHTQYE